MTDPASLPTPLALLPPPEEIQPVAALAEILARIDGWGPRAWREVLGAWKLRCGHLVIEEREGPPCEEAGEVLASLVLPAPWLPRDAAGRDAAADWSLRHARATLLPRLGLGGWMPDPGETVRATNAVLIQEGRLVLRLVLDLPFAGMCADGERFAKALGRIDAWGRAFARSRPGLPAQLRSIRRQRALRAALPAHGLVAFLADGSRLARAPAGGADAGCRPLRAPPGLAVTLDLGRLGRVRGLGLRCGVTAVAGAPYHGKSTLLAAIAGGGDDRPAGDGREGVVADPMLVPVLADDGRPITAQDLTPFYRRLPGGDARAFTTARASGATSMAATVLQAVAAGARLLLIDEDSAAANFLSVSAHMRQLLGRDLDGARTLVEVLPALAKQGVSSVVVAGAAVSALAAADRTILMRAFAPQDATRQARRIAGRMPAGTGCPVPARILAGDPDAILGPRHMLAVETADPERPRWRQTVVDLRRAGFVLDPQLAAGACLAAAWACRLAAGGCPMEELGRRYAAFVAERGPAACDPFHAGFHAVPPWQLVVAVLERLPGLALTSSPAPSPRRAAGPAAPSPSRRAATSRRRP